jgi:8-oxo-dGTP pyrophosphatase MutT (NUDIX family)
LIFCNGKVLLVRIGYLHKYWVFPGGGLHRGEDPREAAIREAKEESGIDVTDVVFIGERLYTNQYKKVTQYYFTAEAVTSDIVIDGQEIIDAGWFQLDSLPELISPRAQEELTMYTNWKANQITPV